MTLLWFPTRPMCKTVQGPAGIKRLERNYRRSQLYAMQRIYEELPLGMPRSTSIPLSKPRSPPKSAVVSKRSNDYDSSRGRKFAGLGSGRARELQDIRPRLCNSDSQPSRNFAIDAALEDVDATP